MTTPSPFYREIPLSKGQVAIVDAQDFDRISKWKWHAIWEPLTKSFYAEAWDYSQGKTRISMHREVMGCVKRDGKQVDHENGNTLDNRRGNLRFVNHSQNQMNRKLTSIGSSGHRGVSLCKKTGQWKARYVLNQKEIWLGRFTSLEDAVAAVKEARGRAYFGYARPK